jgi:hypothetical protein
VVRASRAWRGCASALAAPLVGAFLLSGIFVGLGAEEAVAPPGGAAATVAAPAAAAAPAARCRVMVELSSSSEAPPAYADSLDSMLIQSVSILSVSQAPPGDEPLSLKAEREACPVALRVSLELGAESARLDWKVYLPPREEPVDQGQDKRSLPDARALATTFWRGPAAAVEAAIAEAEIPATYVRIVGEPGTRVSGIGEEIVLPDSGEVEVPLVLPARVVWSARAESALPESGTALVEESGALIEIPRRPLRSSRPWSIEAAALGFSFPELSARYDLGRRLFARATFGQYFLGLSLRDADEARGDSSILASYGLLQPGLGLGCLFSRREAPLRLYTSLDFFLRIAFIEDERAMLEPVAPWGCCLALGADWGFASSGTSGVAAGGTGGDGPALRIFLELGLVYYPWADAELMSFSRSGGMGRAAAGGAGLFKSQPGWFVEFPQPTIGVRFRL